MTGFYIAMARVSFFWRTWGYHGGNALALKTFLSAQGKWVNL